MGLLDMIGFQPDSVKSIKDLVGQDVSQLVVNFMQHRESLESINYTFITLILKFKQSVKVTNFRSISLCNVVYKIIVKVLANRLKQILNAIISPTQSAFIRSRLITDNVLLAFEIMHSLNSQSQSSQRFMAPKIDMSKAYDHVEWVFLQAIMLKMGLVKSLKDLIMECITSVSYSILINGTPQPCFKTLKRFTIRRSPFPILIYNLRLSPIQNTACW